jgi:hypothetical protein
MLGPVAGDACTDQMQEIPMAQANEHQLIAALPRKGLITVLGPRAAPFARYLAGLYGQHGLPAVVVEPCGPTGALPAFPDPSWLKQLAVFLVPDFTWPLFRLETATDLSMAVIWASDGEFFITKGDQRLDSSRGRAIGRVGHRDARVEA